MPVIEWIFLAYYVLGICSGLYYITQGGFHSSRAETLGAVIISLALTLALWFSMPLTWFGTFLMIYEALFACIYGVRYVARPNGVTYTTTSIVVSLVVAVVGLILFLTVGIVA
jgi:hypothetical protein